jgi:hypothetical protein
MPKTQFSPKENGFHFANYFVNVIANVPGVGTVQTAGRCGGMSFCTLDHLAAGLALPAFQGADFGQKGVPPDGHPLADYIYQRQLDSFFVVSAVKFVAWSLAPDAANFLSKGITFRTKVEEFKKLRDSIDRGAPVTLGLIVARDLGGLGRNHQVVAYGYDYDEDAQSHTVHIYDVNWPDLEITLTSGKGDAGWVESSPGKERWRGWFVQDFAPRRPPTDLSRPITPVAATRALEVRGTRRRKAVRVVSVTFERVTFDNPDDPKAASKLALELAVNDRVVRWPARKTRSVRHGTTAKLGNSVKVRLHRGDELVISGRIADDADAWDGEGDVAGRVGTFRERFTASDRWGRGKHTAHSAGDAGTYALDYRID